MKLPKGYIWDFRNINTKSKGGETENKDTRKMILNIKSFSKI